MRGARALRIALDLRHVPSLVRHVRTEPLPDGVLLLLRIAAGEPEAEQEALALVDRSLAEIRDAARFFIEQILFAPGSDSYRVLGAASDASTADLRRNMALLIRWLHPDAETQGERHVFAGRVTSAWEDLKTSDRRAAYDSRVAAAQASALPSGGKTRVRARWKTAPGLASSRKIRRILMPHRRRPPGLLGRLRVLFSRKRWV